MEQKQTPLRDLLKWLYSTKEYETFPRNALIQVLESKLPEERKFMEQSINNKQSADLAVKIFDLPFYGWGSNGMRENPSSVPFDDVFVLRKSVFDIIKYQTSTSKSLEDRAKEFARAGFDGDTPLYDETARQAYIAGATSTASITEDILKELEGRNPYKNSLGIETINQDRTETWNECICVLRQLLNDKTKTKGE